MADLRRITNARFGVRFVRICEALGIKTIHIADKRFCKEFNPCVKIMNTRVSHLCKELKAFYDLEEYIKQHPEEKESSLPF